MRTLIVSEFVTLDGVMEAPGGEPTHPFTGWVMDYEGEEQMAYKFKEVVDAETLLVGRVTYESFAGAWPDYKGEFADRMNSMPKVVVSNTLKDPGVEQHDGARRATSSRASRHSRSRTAVRSSSTEDARSCTRCSTTTWSTSSG